MFSPPGATERGLPPSLQCTIHKMESLAELQKTYPVLPLLEHVQSEIRQFNEQILPKLRAYEEKYPEQAELIRGIEAQVRLKGGPVSLDTNGWTDEARMECAEYCERRGLIVYAYMYEKWNGGAMFSNTPNEDWCLYYYTDDDSHELLDTTMYVFMHGEENRRQTLYEKTGKVRKENGVCSIQ
jgi:hypothetical protein